MTDEILIKNARMVNDGQILEGDLLIRKGRIEQIGRDLAALAATRVLEADGRLLLPGMIDDQVHFREPGVTHKADIHSESRAAVAGGITSYMEMPNTNPQTICLDALEKKYGLAADRSLANFSFYLGATNDNLDAIRALDPNQTCGIKVFMGASTGNMLVDKQDTLETIFKEAPVLVATHCEDTPTIEKNEAEYRKRFGEDVPMEFPEGLFLATILEREEPCDAFVSNEHASIEQLPQDAVALERHQGIAAGFPRPLLAGPGLAGPAGRQRFCVDYLGPQGFG